MKFMIVMALVAFAAHASAQSCTDVENCLTCANPGPLCEDCPDATVISMDRTKCLDCSDGCVECTTNAQDVTTCTKCGSGYYLKAGTCVECGEGCLECHEANNVAVCDKCVASGYAHDLTQAVKPCLACPSNCKTCSVQTDGSTQCSECYSYSGGNTKGYYLKASDKSCKACPSNCEKCTDNGEGKGICTDCYDDYVILVDPTDSTKDGTKCLSCHSSCQQCSGEVRTGTSAKCTECKPDLGNYLSGDECVTCGTGCKNCDADGSCTECKVAFRLTDTTCTACPAFCLTCSLNDENNNVCDECDTGYGTKPASATADVSCDSCALSNCLACDRNAEGKFVCTNCAEGYLKREGKCIACPDGCKTAAASAGCEWDDANSKTKCTTACDAGYTTGGDATEGCGLCTDASLTDSDLQCSTCAWNVPGTSVTCSACKDGYHWDGSSCMAKNIDGCITYSSGAATCDACDDGYVTLASAGPSCATCDDGNCMTCDPAATCTACKTGYHLGASAACVDKATTVPGCLTYTTGADTCDACNDGYVTLASAGPSCVECDTSNCKTCSAADTCTACKEGYYLESNTCKVCSSNCKICSSADCTTCKDFYALDADTKTCKACPSKCSDCTYDTTAGKTKCADDKCDRGSITGYTVNNEGDCEECPENCNVCEYNADAGAVVCSSNTDCDNGYGTKNDMLCYPCPSNCKDCTVNAETDNLICDTCNANYALNSDVCAKCPSNCAKCSNNQGSMVCSACSDGYALDSNSVCVKCPSNCESCTATTCKECNSGYALSGDRKACVACSSAAFDNCALCTNIDAASDKANCTACASGYVLEDEEEHLSCKSTSSLSCGSGSTYDNDAECSTCADGFQQIDDYKCAKMCYSCGNPESGEFVAKDQCTIPTGNATETDAKLIPCFSGVCYSGRNADGQVNAGCHPTPSTCTEGDGETCKSLPDGPQLCSRCCTSDKCNTFVAELDGWADNSGTNMAASLLLLAAAALLAAF